MKMVLRHGIKFYSVPSPVECPRRKNLGYDEKGSDQRGRRRYYSKMVSKFVMSYRVTPNSVMTKGRSSTRCMFGRKTQTVFNSVTTQEDK